MKFVCERCHTRYSIADDKVRQKILKIRCKTCENVITVRDPGSDGGEPAGRAAPPPPPRAPAGGVAAAREWFVAVNGEQVGPMTRSDTARRVLQSKQDDEIYVWKHGLDGWKVPSDVPTIHQEMNVLAARPSASRPAVVQPPHPPGKPSPARPTSGASAKGGASANLGAKGPAHAPISGGGRGSVPATARLADNDSYADEDHTQIQPFDAAVFAPEGFARSSSGPGAVLPFTAPGKADRPERATNGEAAAAPMAALDGLFSGMTPVHHPSGGVVVNPMGAVPAQSTRSYLALRRPPMIKFVAAGAVLAVLVVLLVILLGSRPKDSKVAQTPAPSVAVTPPVVDDSQTRPATEPQPKPGVVSEVDVPPLSPAPRRPGRGVAQKGAHPAAPTAPRSLEPAPLSPDQAAAPPRGGGPERRVHEYKGTRPGGAAQAADGPTEAMIIAVVKKNQSTIKSCYERALKRDDRLRSGRIDVTAELGSSGTVTSVSLTAPPEFVTVEACIKTAVRRWAFPVAPHGYRAEFPLILQGNL
jgi:predicted Zn finger-like uncharacterized protein